MMENKKIKIGDLIVIAVAWLIAISILYLVALKVKNLFEHRFW